MRTSVLLILAPAIAGAQIPSAPVLQNAWASPGIVIAGNVGGGSDGSVYAGAASWAPSSGRFQLSGGGGFQVTSGQGSRAVYGARVALPLMSLMGGSFGLSGFAGVGGGSGGDDSLAVTSLIPVGVAIGYRRGIGATRGFSVYGSPMYQFFSSGAGSSGLLRVGLGVDAAVTSRIGVTVGMELGQKADSAVARHGSIVYGVGVSFALGRR